MSRKEELLRELALIEEKERKKSQKAIVGPTKGKLKHDLYWLVNVFGSEIKVDIEDIIDEYGDYFSKEVRQIIINRAKQCAEDSIERDIKKGAIFEKYDDDDWVGKYGEVEGGMSDKWAERNLDIIKE